MGSPAARVGDMHICPMFDGPKPHMGGPIMPPGNPNVLVGGMPAATIGNMCTCVGPPDSISEGKFTVLIGGAPAAAMGHQCLHGGMISIGCPIVHYGGSSLKSSNPLVSVPGLLELVIMSPTLVGKLDSLLAAGWEFSFGEVGKGTFCSKEKNKIVIDPAQIGNILSLTQSLAHEAGHATYTEDPYVAHDGLTRTQYADANTNRHLKDEGEATLTNVEVRNEIMEETNGASDIGIAGTNQQSYENTAAQYKSGAIDRDQARQDIGNVFADNENTSTTKETYRRYYSGSYEDFYDKQNNP